MDILEVQQPGGFPLETDTLNFMQETYNLLGSLTSVAGDLSIVAGCNMLGNFVSNGVVVINHELLPFVGGPKGNYVVIVEETETRNFKSGETKVVFKKRHATFGAGTGQKKWSDFVRITPLKTMGDFHTRLSKLEKYCAPFTEGGSYVLWNRPANEIPEGWEEAVEMRGKFPVGWLDADTAFGNMGGEGGQKEVEITVDQMPNHNHNATASSAGGHQHSYSDSYYIEKNQHLGNLIPGTEKELFGSSFDGSGDTDGDNDTILYRNRMTAGAGAHGHDISVDSAGGNQPVNVLNPYRIVMFIKPVID